MDTDNNILVMASIKAILEILNKNNLTTNDEFIKLRNEYYKIMADLIK